MKKFPLLCLVLVSVLFMNCEEESESTLEVELTGDELLKKHLVNGDYKKYEDEIYIFYQDDTFIEDIFYIDNNNSQRIHYYTRTGKYEIVNSLLIMKEVIIEYHDSSDFYSGELWTSWNDLELSLMNDSIKFQVCQVFESVGENINLWGIWERIEWVSEYLSGDQHSYHGRVKLRYSFDQDSSTVQFSKDLIDDPSKSKIQQKYNFTYNEPKIIIEGQETIRQRVELKNDRMYWYNSY